MVFYPLYPIYYSQLYVFCLDDLCSQVKPIKQFLNKADKFQIMLLQYPDIVRHELTQLTLLADSCFIG